ncbi:MAG: nuclease-related domain-containing protein [Sulfuricaulis sp.]
MADLRFVQPNRLRLEVRRYQNRLLLIGVPLLAFGAWINVILLLPVLIGILFLWNAKQQRLYGAEGEDRALGIPVALPGSLATLPDDYTVFNQVKVPNGTSHRELDFVVVGPNGIFAIEVKHCRGKVSGQETDNTWRQRKRSRAGNTYEQPQRNPVRQIKGAIYTLKQYLLSSGLNEWIQGIVVFTHPDCTLSVGPASVPVLTLDGLTPYIRNYQPRRAPVRIGTIVRTLKLLREGFRPAGQLQHISYFMKDFVTPAERVAGTMNYDIETAIKKQQRCLKELPATVAPVRGSYSPPVPARRKPATFTVIQGGRSTPTIKKVREVTLFVRRTESETVVEGDES